ncbi:sporulation protein [Streptomyces sp. NBC_00572]|uniref:sporulation protein n=1 Tax=Streptomyces sp. NBC_00572 TaxID=2903664 RepID=UPI00225908FA|nr:sporulation protein [Streptomyces sp. NBC_00572]MCX4982625.1 sporulation protein [Streptomyces sp. NBC_00572]
MVFKRLLGMGGIPLEIDTLVQSEPALPGGLLRGEVVLRAPDRRVEVKSIYLKLVTDAPVAHKGDGDGYTGDTFDYPSVSGYFTLEKGEERRIPLRHRLKWETPLTEVKGQKLGVHLGLHTEVDAEGIKAQTDDDLVHITALPLHEAVLDAFAAEGYALETSRIHNGTIPRTEYHVYRQQGLLLVDEQAGQDRPRELELHFHTNAVGCEIFLRKAALKERNWKSKPPARRYVAAHHEVGRVDFGEEVRRWIGEVVLLGGSHAAEEEDES